MLANGGWDLIQRLTLTLLTWTIWRAPTNARKWRMGFNSAFKGLIIWHMSRNIIWNFSTESLCYGIGRFMSAFANRSYQVTSFHHTQFLQIYFQHYPPFFEVVPSLIQNLCGLLSRTTRATHNAYVIHLDFIIIIIYCVSFLTWPISVGSTFQWVFITLFKVY